MIVRSSLARDERGGMENPALLLPGPQPHNQIAGDPEEQLARARAGRRSPQPSPLAARKLVKIIEAFPDTFRPILLTLLGPPLGRWIADLLEEFP